MEPLRPSGYIRVGNELWKAELVDRSLAVDRGEIVRTVDRRGLTLIVVPFDRDPLAASKSMKSRMSGSHPHEAAETVVVAALCRDATRICRLSADSRRSG
jgi:hypothetical protein